MSQINDYSISVQEIKSLAPKVNQGLRIMMVLSGELTVETNSRYYAMEEKDVLVINRNQLYQINGSNHNKVLIVSISDQYMNQHYEGYRNSQLECFSKEVDMGREKLIKTIRKLLAETLLSYYRRSESYKIEIQSNISNILLVLIRQFNKKVSSLEKNATADQRLNQIISFMEKHYDQQLTLDDTARKFYLS
jgi:YesN/AraC family two-component response regulator